MKVHKIAVIPGDGIGPEVLEEGIKILKKTACLDGGFSFEFTHFPWGCEYYLKHGRMMDENGIEMPYIWVPWEHREYRTIYLCGNCF